LYGLHRAGMRPPEMVAVTTDIFDWELPVGHYFDLLCGADEFGTARQRIQASFQVPAQITQIVTEGGGVTIEAAEDQTMVRLDAFHRN